MLIDDATIKKLAVQCGANLGMKLDGILYVVPKTANFTIDQLRDFARAIEQLARDEQREEDALVCDQLQFEMPYETGMANECAEAIRASGKERKID